MNEKKDVKIVHKLDMNDQDDADIFALFSTIQGYRMMLEEIAQNKAIAHRKVWEKVKQKYPNEKYNSYSHRNSELIHEESFQEEFEKLVDDKLRELRKEAKK